MSSTYVSLKQNVIEIGDRIIGAAHRRDSVYWWDTVAAIRSPTGWSYQTRSHANLYSGVAGIALFLIELGRYSRHAKYLRVGVGALQWIQEQCFNNPAVCYERHEHSLAFYTGRLGIAYTFVRAASITGDIRWVEDSLKLVEADIKSGFPGRGASHDLVHGTSGTLLGLSFLFAARQETWLADALQYLVRHLSSHLHTSRTGVCWDRSARSVDALCGMAHGMSGIALSLLEVGRYFRCPDLLLLAKLALAYEREHYDSTVQNWPDLRWPVIDTGNWLATLEALRARNERFFHTKRDVVAWCHGAAGIGLCRLRAWETLRDSASYNDLLLACSKVTRRLQQPSEFDFLGLCHGLAGKAELLLEVSGALADSQLRKVTWSVARQLASWNRVRPASNADGVEDYGLFQGQAGVGYFLLRVLDGRTPSVLAPRLPTIGRSGIIVADALEAIFRSAWPATSTALTTFSGALGPQNTQPYQPPAGSHPYNLAEAVLRCALGKVRRGRVGTPASVLDDAINFDRSCRAFDQMRVNDIHTYCLRALLYRYLKDDLPDVLDDETMLHLASHVTVISARYAWPDIIGNNGKWQHRSRPRDTSILLERVSGGLQSRVIDHVEKEVMETLAKGPVKVTSLVADVSDKRSGHRLADVGRCLERLIMDGVIEISDWQKAVRIE